MSVNRHNEVEKGDANRLWRDMDVNAKEVSSQEKKKTAASICLLYGICDTPFGKCLVGVCEEGICHMSFFRSAEKTHIREFESVWSNLKNRRDDSKATGLLRDLLISPRHMPRILLLGTRFQQRVWGKLMEVGEGETLCYSDLARMIGEPTAVRAVSNAVARNPVAYLVPCHRVIGKAGDLCGYRWGLEVKRAMLEHERAVIAHPPPPVSRFIL